MRRMEREFERELTRALNALRLALTRGLTDENVSALPWKLDDEAITRPFHDAIVGQLGRVAVAGSAFGRRQVEQHGFGVAGKNPAKAADVEIGAWELANNEAANWARAYGYELVRKLLDTTRDALQAEISEYILNSETIGQLTTRIRLASGFSEERARLVAITEVTRAFAMGGMQAWKASGVIEGREWRTNNDEIVAECPICAPMNGQVTALDKPWEHPTRGEIDLPGHPRCILPGNEVVIPGRLSAAAKSFYNGRAIEITVRSGRVLTVTENHPILTPAGYVAAKSLHEGGYVISTRDADRIAAAVNPDNDHVPTAIEQVYRSFKKAGLVASYTVPASAEDFHGDGRAIYGDIEIVYAYGLLESNSIPALFEQVGQVELSSGSMAFGALPPLSLSNLRVSPDRTPTGRLVRWGEPLPPLVLRHERPLEKLSLGTAASSDASFKQSVTNSPSVDAQTVGNGFLGLASVVAGNDAIGVQADALASPVFIDPGALKDTGNDLIRHALLAGQFANRFSGLIAPDEIVSIREFDFCGHVYDLQCDDYELYITSGVITSNCRCWAVPVVNL